MTSKPLDLLDSPEASHERFKPLPQAVPPLLLRYFQAFMLRKWLMLLLFLGGMSLALAYTLMQPRLYTATSQIQINRDQKNVANVEGVNKNLDEYDLEFYDTQYTLLKSRSLAERVARNLKLGSNKDFFKECFGIEQGQGQLASQDQITQQEQVAASLLQSGIVIKPVLNSSLVDVSFTCRSPLWAARIANDWPIEFKDASMDRRLSTSVDARRILEGKISDLRSKLELSERNLIEFVNGHGIVTLASSRDASGKVTETRTVVANNLEAMNTALIEARTSRIAAEGAIASGGKVAAGNSTIAALNEKRTGLQAEYAKLLVQFEPQHPSLIAIQQQISILDASIASEMSSLRRQSSASYREAVKRENDLRTEVGTLTGSYRKQQEEQIQLNILQRDVDTNRQLFDALLQRYKEIGVAGSVDISNIVIVDNAKVPGGPSSPNLTRNLFVGLVLGIALATLAVFMLEQLDEAIRDPADVEQQLMLPLLGTIPIIGDDPIEQLDDPKSVMSESYFSVRTSLDLATSQGFPKLVAITSSKASEGKSTSAFALAFSLARVGKKVLLVDGDMRAPSIHKLTDTWNEFGLSNLLAGDDSYSRAITASAVENLSVLLSGPTPPSAAELLSTDRVKTVFEHLRRDFDFVIIDAPPILGLANSPLLGRSVDGFVFVLEAQDTTVRAARASLQRLLVGENHVFGVILTKFNSAVYGYGSDYEYQYGKKKKKAG